jgi:sec-independent protein translocase protein TatC
MLAAQKTGGGGHGPFDLILVLAGLRDAPAMADQNLRLCSRRRWSFFFTRLKLAGFGRSA